MDIEKTIQTALMHHSAGRLPQAEALYRQVLERKREHPEATHYLGMLLCQQGRHDVGLEMMRHAVRLKPSVADFHANLGEVLRSMGRPADAVPFLQKAIDMRGGDALPHYNLGRALEAIGRREEAAAAYRRAATLKRDFVAARSDLGRLLQSMGRLQDAMPLFREVVAMAPRDAAAHYNLGTLFSDLRQFEAAAACYSRAIALGPEMASAHYNLGLALMAMGRLEEAAECLRRAIQHKPDHVSALNNLGNLLQRLGRSEEAIKLLQGALRFAPADAAILTNLGSAYQAAGSLDEALVSYRNAITLNPGYAAAHNNLAGALIALGEVAGAVESLRKAIAAKPDYIEAHSSMLLAMHYAPEESPPQLLEEHLRFARAHAEPLRRFIRPFTNDRAPDRKLRVGFVSGDFREHSVAFLVEPLLAELDREQFEVFCYADVLWPDHVTRRLKSYSAQWRYTVSANEMEFVDLVRRDGVDILVDLAGHTVPNRLLAFACRAAPVQATYLGYPNTTGLEQMDWRLTDALADPPGQSESLHTERLWRLPGSFLCYRPPDDAPEVGGPTGDRITFGSFNNLAKLNEPTIDLWGLILKQVEGSRLLLKSQHFADSASIARVMSRIGSRGIAPDRVEVLPRQRSLGSHLAMYQRVDIALDTFPYNGTVTTCEALWMGVPVIVRRGQAHLSRVGSSILSNIGLEEFIAADGEEFVAMAVRLATDASRLRELKTGLRERMARSRLTDAKSFARDFAAALRGMWHEECDGGRRQQST